MYANIHAMLPRLPQSFNNKTYLAIIFILFTARGVGSAAIVLRLLV
jgi:hypothetical protein